MSVIPDPPSRALAAFVTDLDRTLTNTDGRPSALARDALAQARGAGLLVIVASGRTYDDLRRCLDGTEAVDALVAENGAVVEAPRGSTPEVEGRSIGSAVRARLPLGPPPGFELGEVVVSVPLHEVDELRTRLEGLPVDWIANVDRMMVLPRGCSKLTGVRTALQRLGRGDAPFAAIGDGENDAELLAAAVLSASVANATSAARAAARYHCQGAGDAGVAEFVRGPVSRAIDAR